MLDIAAIYVILLHAPGGHTVTLNPAAIVAMREGRQAEEHNKLLTDEVKCIISTSDGKLVNVIETCAEIRLMIDEAREKGIIR